MLKVEPLANVSHLEKYLSKMLVRQWFDYDRASLHFLSATPLPHLLPYSSDFDEHGLLHWIGTNGLTAPWVNPASSNGLVRVSGTGSGLEEICGRQTTSCQTTDEKRAWVAVDLGVFVVPTCYSLRCSRAYAKMAPRNWAFLMSKTGGPEPSDWDLLYMHVNDESLKEAGGTHTWSLAEAAVVRREAEAGGWRYARIQQMGRNQSGSSYALAVCGFEIYGTVGCRNVEMGLGVCFRLEYKAIHVY